MAAKAKAKPSPFRTGRMESSGGGGKFLSLKDGDTVTIASLIELDEMVSAFMHEYWDVRPAIYHPCVGVGCPGCAVGNKPRQKGYLPVVDREGNVSIFPFTSSIYNQIEALESSLAEDAKKGEPILKGFVIKITRRGSGLTTKYSVVGTGKYVDVTALEIPEIIDHLGSVDAEEIQKKLDEAGVIAETGPKAAASDDDDDKWS